MCLAWPGLAVDNKSRIIINFHFIIVLISSSHNFTFQLIYCALRSASAWLAAVTYYRCGCRSQCFCCWCRSYLRYYIAYNDITYLILCADTLFWLQTGQWGALLHSRNMTMALFLILNNYALSYDVHLVYIRHWNAQLTYRRLAHYALMSPNICDYLFRRKSRGFEPNLNYNCDFYSIAGKYVNSSSCCSLQSSQWHCRRGRVQRFFFGI